MEGVTWGQMKSYIYNKHDLENSDMFSEDELIQMANEGISMAEARVISLNQDYFLATLPEFNLIADQSDYDLPSEIYAHKLRRVFYDFNGKKSKLDSIRNLDDIISNSCGEMKYKIISIGTEKKIRVFPTPKSNDGKITIYYTKNASKINNQDGDNQICDIPEFIDVVYKYMTVKINEKDMNPLLQHSREELVVAERLMIDALSVAVNDDDNEIEPDLSFYEGVY